MKPPWYDKRAKQGELWTVQERIQRVDFDGGTGKFVAIVEYEPERWVKAFKDDRDKYGAHTKEEAEALAKLLTASEREL